MGSTNMYELKGTSLTQFMAAYEQHITHKSIEDTSQYDITNTL